jgi:hypothetical protein
LVIQGDHLIAIPLHAAAELGPEVANEVGVLGLESQVHTLQIFS